MHIDPVVNIYIFQPKFNDKEFLEYGTIILAMLPTIVYHIDNCRDDITHSMDIPVILYWFSCWLEIHYNLKLHGGSGRY